MIRGVKLFRIYRGQVDGRFESVLCVRTSKATIGIPLSVPVAVIVYTHKAFDDATTSMLSVEDAIARLNSFPVSSRSRQAARLLEWFTHGIGDLLYSEQFTNEEWQ